MCTFNSVPLYHFSSLPCPHPAPGMRCCAVTGTSWLPSPFVHVLHLWDRGDQRAATSEQPPVQMATQHTSHGHRDSGPAPQNSLHLHSLSGGLTLVEICLACCGIRNANLKSKHLEISGRGAVQLTPKQVTGGLLVTTEPPAQVQPLHPVNLHRELINNLVLGCKAAFFFFLFGIVLYYVPSNLVAINTLLINWKFSPSSILTSQTTHERALEIKEILFQPHPSDRGTDGIQHPCGNGIGNWAVVGVENEAGGVGVEEPRR